MVSAEPLLGAVDFTAIKAPPDPHAPDEDWVFDALATGDIYYQRYINPDYGTSFDSGDGPYRDTKIEWVVSGGESGPGARPMRVEWVRSIVQQCKAAGVPCFVKQMGPAPIMDEVDAVQAVALGAGWDRLEPPDDRFGFVRLRNRKGADMVEWPADLRVREAAYAT